MGKFHLERKALREKIKRYNILKIIDNSFLVKLLAPKKNSDGYKRSKRNLEKLGFKVSVERVITYEVIIMIVTFVLMMKFGGYFIVEKNNKIIGSNVLHEKIQSNSFNRINIQNQSGLDIVNVLAQKTIKIIPGYKKLINTGNYHEVIAAIHKVQKELDILDTNGTITKQVFEKLYNISNNKLNFFYIVLSTCISLLMTRIVNIYLIILNSIRDTRIDTEFRLIEIITIILLKNRRMNVQKVLTCQRENSKLLKKYYDDCLRIYSTNKYEAISNLIKEVDNTEFSRFMTLIKENLVGNEDTNIRLLEAHKDLRNKIIEKKYLGKLDHVSRVFTLLSFPLWICALALLFIPIIVYYNLAL